MNVYEEYDNEVKRLADEVMNNSMPDLWEDVAKLLLKNYNDFVEDMSK